MAERRGVKEHLRLMTLAADIGACILPPIPAFHRRPATIDDIIDRTLGRIYDHFGIEHDLFERRGEPGDPKLRELK